MSGNFALGNREVCLRRHPDEALISPCVPGEEPSNASTRRQAGEKWFFMAASAVAVASSCGVEQSTVHGDKVQGCAEGSDGSLAAAVAVASTASVGGWEQRGGEDLDAEVSQGAEDPGGGGLGASWDSDGLCSARDSPAWPLSPALSQCRGRSPSPSSPAGRAGYGAWSGEGAEADGGSHAGDSDGEGCGCGAGHAAVGAG